MKVFGFFSVTFGFLDFFLKGFLDFFFFWKVIIDSSGTNTCVKALALKAHECQGLWVVERECDRMWLVQSSIRTKDIGYNYF